MDDTTKGVSILHCGCAWNAVEVLSAEEISNDFCCLPRAANHFPFEYLFSHGTSQGLFSVIRLQRLIIQNMTPRFRHRVLKVTYHACIITLYNMGLHFVCYVKGIEGTDLRR